MTKGESVAVLLLLFISLVVGLWPYKYPVNASADFSKLSAYVDSIDATDSVNKELPINSKRFRFNPNVASLDELLSLGFNKKIAKRILNYREKIGHFKSKEDLSKIYDMDTVLLSQLSDLIDLPNVKDEKKSFNFSVSENKNKPSKPLIEINSADSAAFESLPCIGAKLAVRIINYRQKLGGFVLLNQLKEVYGIDSNCLPDILNKLTIDIQAVKKIKVNSADLKTLSDHPYIGKYLAQNIVAYRNQHGKFSHESDLLKLKTIHADKLKKISPYLDFSQ
ncbi:MAG: helix-hairpin-helix domain-containing protein [Bacteroidetes bacterium]|nr:helix-hairpin-helix domain-containing protein [Bacteroidota bacterium]